MSMNRSALSLPKLSGNELKLLAVVSMTIDHIGFFLLPNVPILRIAGRLAFPLFAAMIAEGCRYTHSPRRYFGSMLAFGAVCQLVYFFFLGSLYQCVLITFSLGILVCFAVRFAHNCSAVSGTPRLRVWGAWAMAAASVAFVWFICNAVPRLLPGTDFAVDYGFWGAMLPAACFVPRHRGQKLALAAVDLILLSLSISGLQWWCLAALVPLACYSGKRGRSGLKHFFYVYYPAHLVAIYGIGVLLRQGH